MSRWSMAQTSSLLLSRREHNSEYTSLRIIAENDDTLWNTNYDDWRESVVVGCMVCCDIRGRSYVVPRVQRCHYALEKYRGKERGGCSGSAQCIAERQPLHYIHWFQRTNLHLTEAVCSSLTITQVYNNTALPPLRHLSLLDSLYGTSRWRRWRRRRRWWWWCIVTWPLVGWVWHSVVRPKPYVPFGTTKVPYYDT